MRQCQKLFLGLWFQCLIWEISGQTDAEADPGNGDTTSSSSSSSPPESSSSASNCPLVCYNGSVCKAGQASFEDHPKNADGGALAIHVDTSLQDFYCECPKGFTGVLCTIPYDVCADTSVTDHVCYHGGTCHLQEENNSNGNAFECDCSSAVSSEDDDGTRYVGKYCELAPEIYCDEFSSGGDNFCVNDGICRPPPSKGCICAGEFEGDHCEFRKQDESTTPDANDGSNNNNKPVCDLPCVNGGTCQVEKGDDGSDNEYCDCPVGVVGALCEHDVGNGCGLHTCYHGSECRQAGDGSLYCDCTTASTNDPQTHYAGQFCQYEATTYCGLAHDYFCANGGTCQATPQSNGAYLCDCPDGWTGPSCEFESDDRDHAYDDCTLTCYNGGKCRRGGPNMASPSDPDFLSSLVNETEASPHHEEREHCVCPSGFTGSKCEHSYELCGNGEHMCLHGSKCVPPQDVLHPLWTCDCEKAHQDNLKYAGEFCQHHHTSMCTTDDMSNAFYEGSVSLAFCVNDGVCTQFEQDGINYPACQCPEQYTGVHCELLKAELPPSTLARHSHEAALLFVIFLLAILFVVISIAVIYKRRYIRLSQKRYIESDVTRAHFKDDPTKSPDMEELNFEDEEPMEEIELL